MRHSSFRITSLDTLTSMKGYFSGDNLYAASFDLGDFNSDGLDDLVVWYSILGRSLCLIFPANADSSLGEPIKQKLDDF